MTNYLVFSDRPSVQVASNWFINVPIILQYEETPLIQVVKEEQIGFTTEIPIYHPDGTYLAKVKGSQLYPTQEGFQAGVTLEHPDRMTVCKMGTRTLFEIKRTEAAALRTSAELYTADGYFVKCAHESPLQLFDTSGEQLRVGGVTMSNSTVSGCRIGILVTKNSVAIACS